MRHRCVLLDTSPLVSIFQPREQTHPICVETLGSIEPPLITSWPVLTEAHYLLRTDQTAQQKMLELAASDQVLIAPLQDNFLSWCMEFSELYADQDVQLADASLVWLAMNWKTDVIFTLDRRDFSVFRIPHGGDARSFLIIPE